MPLALILSSQVAASRVGGGAQALALAALKIDPVVVPTVLFGRHPGWGAPGGAAVPVETFEGVLDGIEANGLFGMVDLLLTGYFGSAAQVRAAGRAIDAVRAAPRDGGAATRRALVLVDPTIGDADKGLYVAPEVAGAIAAELLPRADLVAPNLWELSRLADTPVREPREVLNAARLLGKPVLVSSLLRGREIGVAYAQPQSGEAWLAAHNRLPNPPRGTGDLLTALYGAAVIQGQTPQYALSRAVGGVAEAVTAAQGWNAPELPLVALGARLRTPNPAVRMERLS